MTSTGIATFIIALFLLISFIQIDKYGFGDDEQWLFLRGQLSIEIVSSLLKGTAPPASPDIFWLYYPSFYGTLNYHFSYRFLSFLGFGHLASCHTLNILFAGLSLLALYLLARKVSDGETALYTVLFPLFYPRFIAHAHYNPKEIPLFAFLILSLCFLYSWTHTGKKKDLVFSAVLLALAGSVHLNALTLFPVVPILLCAVIFGRSGSSFGSAESSRLLLFLRCFLIYFVTVLAAFFALWPLLWVEPLKLFESIGRVVGKFQHFHLRYLGETYSRNDAPWHYAPFYLLVTTPLLTILLVVTGFLTKLREPRRNAVVHLMLLTWAAIPIVIRMNPWVVKYNDIRHVLISLPPLMIYAAWGVKFIVNQLTGRFPKHKYKIISVLTASFIAYSMMQIAPVHPYEGDYFNELFRSRYPRDIQEHFDFPSWLSIYKDGVDWLNENAEPGSGIAVPHRMSIMRMYEKRGDLHFSNQRPFDYLMIAGQGWKLDPLLELDAVPVLIIERYRSRMLSIYKMGRSVSDSDKALVLKKLRSRSELPRPSSLDLDSAR